MDVFQIQAQQQAVDVVGKAMTIFKLTSIILFSLLAISGTCQSNNLAQLVDSLKYADSSYKKCNSTYWRIIKKGDKVIPYLIVKLSDSTKTKLKGYCKTDYLTIGELSYLALDQIIPLPLFQLTEVEFDLIQNGCLVGLLDYLKNNREKFKLRASNWYFKNKNKIIWTKSASFDLNECQKQNGILGYYKVK